MSKTFQNQSYSLRLPGPEKSMKKSWTFQEAWEPCPSARVSAATRYLLECYVHNG